MDCKPLCPLAVWTCSKGNEEKVLTLLWRIGSGGRGNTTPTNTVSTEQRYPSASAMILKHPVGSKSFCDAWVIFKHARGPQKWSRNPDAAKRVCISVVIVFTYVCGVSQWDLWTFTWTEHQFKHLKWIVTLVWYHVYYRVQVGTNARESSIEPSTIKCLSIKAYVLLGTNYSEHYWQHWYCNYAAC